MAYNLKHFDIQCGGHIIGSIHDIIVEESDEMVGKIKILSKERFKNESGDEMWRYKFIVEYNKEEQDELVRRLRKLGYM